MSVFNSNLVKLRISAANLKCPNKVNGFRKTNIKPFINDLEQVAEAMSLLNKYKKILETDITLLDRTGTSIQELDTQLSNMSGR